MKKKTVIRLKRRRSQSPVSALKACSASKQARLGDEDEVIFTFSATAKNIEEAKELASKRSSSAKAKATPKRREERREEEERRRNEKRYKIVAKNRDEDRGEEIVDIEREEEEEEEGKVTCNGKEMKREKDLTVDAQEKYEDGYVYDIYHLASDEGLDIEDGFLERLNSIQDWEGGDLLLDGEGYRDREDCFEDDTDDSNDEDNYRNDYPDEEEYCRYAYDSEEDGDDEDFGLDGLKISKGGGSDEEEEGLCYTKKDFEHDSDLHGASYARYKRRILGHLDPDNEEEEDDDDIDAVDEF